MTEALKGSTEESVLGNLLKKVNIKGEGNIVKQLGNITGGNNLSTFESVFGELDENSSPLKRDGTYLK